MDAGCPHQGSDSFEACSGEEKHCVGSIKLWEFNVLYSVLKKQRIFILYSYPIPIKAQIHLKPALKKKQIACVHQNCDRHFPQRFQILVSYSVLKKHCWNNFCNINLFSGLLFTPCVFKLFLNPYLFLFLFLGNLHYHRTLLIQTGGHDIKRGTSGL